MRKPGSWELLQSRSANPVNEITCITNTIGADWAQPGYDRAGNMTTIPQPNDPTKSFTATYDAWNRLVKLVDGVNTVSEYAYDGRAFRIIQKSYSSGVLSETRNLYYNSGWQDVEERLGTTPDSASANRQFVWGSRYIDDLLLRDRDTDDDGSMNERLYAPGATGESFGSPVLFAIHLEHRRRIKCGNHTGGPRPPPVAPGALARHVACIPARRWISSGCRRQRRKLQIFWPTILPMPTND